MQGGRYKAMFKLDASMAEARKLAEKHPDRFDVGSTAWVTARFTADEPMPGPLWKKWLEESYQLSVSPPGKTTAKKKTAKKKAGKTVARKSRPAKKTASKNKSSR